MKSMQCTEKKATVRMLLEELCSFSGVHNYTSQRMKNPKYNHKVNFIYHCVYSGIKAKGRKKVGYIWTVFISILVKKKKKGELLNCEIKNTSPKQKISITI